MTAIPKPGKRKRSTRPGRLTGEALEKLRRDCFDRDGYSCQHWIQEEQTDGRFFSRKCRTAVIWESGYPNSGHMAHIIPRSLGGPDTLDNVVTKCADCHLRREHAMAER